MRLRRVERPGREVWNDCTGCMCHEMAMQFGEGDSCDECGCPTTLAAFDRASHPIADVKPKTRKVGR